MSQVSLGRPEFVPGTPPGHPTAKFLYVIFLYRFFLSLIIGYHSAFLKHAFREVTSGFRKGTVPEAPPRPSPGPLRMPKNISKETHSVPPEGHLLVKNM